MGVELPLHVVVTILECCVTFSGVKLSIRSFVLFIEYMKYVNKFWGEIYSESCQLFESFYRFQLTLMYHKKSIFFVRLIFTVICFFLIVTLNEISQIKLTLLLRTCSVGSEKAKRSY